jgi:hypothetical protein
LPRPIEEVVVGPEGLAVATVDADAGVEVGHHHAEILANQWATYAEQRPKSVLELQPWRSTCTMNTATTDGREGVATMIDLVRTGLGLRA